MMKKLIIIKMKFIAHLSRKLKGKIQYFFTISNLFAHIRSWKVLRAVNNQI